MRGRVATGSRFHVLIVLFMTAVIVLVGMSASAGAAEDRFVDLQDQLVQEIVFA